MANTRDSGDYRVTKEPLGCASCTNPKFLDGTKDVNSLPIYANVIERTDGKTVDIVYWVFYPYNNGKEVCVGYYDTSILDLGCIGYYSTFGNHVGDWEHFVIRFEKGYGTTVYLS